MVVGEDDEENPPRGNQGQLAVLSTFIYIKRACVRRMLHKTQVTTEEWH